MDSRHGRARPHTVARALLAARLAAGAIAALAPPSHALARQIANPVYVDDSTAAVDGLIRAGELARAGNLGEAVRVLQKLLNEDAERVIADPAEPDLFVSVRSRINATLLKDPVLLEQYRADVGAAAQKHLEQGDVDRVEESYLLTPAGFDAALRVAQRRLERAQFWGAWRALEQLRDHPDRRADNAAGAARLALLVARYVGSEALERAAHDWALDAGLPEAEAPNLSVEPPPITVGRTPFDASGPIELRGMLPKPLWSDGLSIGPADNAADLNDMRPGAQRLPSLSILPTVAGDSIYVNTGREVGAWDRLTLAPRWPRRSFSSAALDPARPGIDASDSATVTAWGPWLVLTSGRGRNISRDGDPRIHAIDADSGAILWSTDVASLDPALEEAYVRGPAIIEQGVVIVAASKTVQQRRLSSVYLVGLDLADGSLLWRRLLGSAGAMPYGAQSVSADSAEVNDGVVYRMDSVGVVSAIESAGGRLRWIRRIPPQPIPNPAGPASWKAHLPIIHGDRLITLTPDRLNLVALDLDTGAEVARLAARPIGSPDYLLLHGDTLIAVGNDAIYALPASLAEDDGAPRRILPPDAPTIRGRVILAGDRLLAPVSDGLLSASIRRDEPITHVPLDRSGNILPLPDQLIVVDDSAVHTYLLWEVAEKMLTERMEEDPTDPVPAVTYAELAYRAGRPNFILPAADLAIQAINLDPGDPAVESSRQRLFRAVLGMLAPDTAPVAPLGEAVVSGLVERLGVLASAPNERVAHLMVAGDYHESRSQPARAVERYQSILEDSALADASYASRGVSARADLEATRRLRRIVRKHGPAVYTVFEAEAQRALDQASRAANAADFEKVALRWPVSAAASKAWLLASESDQRAGNRERAVQALEAALLAAEDALVNDQALIGEIAGRLLLALRDAGHPRAAVQALDRILVQRPGIALTDRGETIDLASLSLALNDALALHQRRPRIGRPTPGQSPQILRGSIVDPIVAGDNGPSPTHIAIATNIGELTVLRAAPNAGVEPLWTMSLASNARLLRLDEDSAYLSLEPEGEPLAGRTFTRISLANGPNTPLWTTPPFRTLFNAEAGRIDQRLAEVAQGRAPNMETALGAIYRLTDLVVAFDQRTLALVERSGRAAAFDLETGRPLWTLEHTVWEVADAAAEAGVLYVGGVLAPDADRPNMSGEGVVVAIDIRTGRTLDRAAPGLGPVRWIRASTSARAAIGFNAGVICLDPLRAQERWRVTAPNARTSLNAWSFPGRLIVMDSNENLWQIDEDTGVLRESPIDAAGRVRRTDRVVTYAIEDRAVFCTTSGILMLAPNGAVVGRDARADRADILPPLLTEDSFIALDANAAADDAIYDLRYYTLGSAAQTGAASLALGADPFEMGAIDGCVLVSAGDITVVYEAPAVEP